MWLDLSDELSTFGLILHESVHFRDGTVEGDHSETMVGSIQDQILAHDGQTYEAKIATGFGRRGGTDIDAGQSRSKVSKQSLSIECCLDILRDGEQEGRFIIWAAFNPEMWLIKISWCCLLGGGKKGRHRDESEDIRWVGHVEEVLAGSQGDCKGAATD